MSHTIEIRCVVDIEQTPEFLHAHAIPEGVEIRPGDRVQIHGAPAAIRFGERLRTDCRATVFRAGPITRAWTRLTAIFDLTELYEVGFQPEESL